MIMVKKTKETEKGRVYYVKTSKGVHPLSTLFKAADKKTSKQVKATEKWMYVNGLIPPPYLPESFLLFYESNPIFNRCVKQLAVDVAGLGWNLVVKEEGKENDKEHERLMMFLKKVNLKKESIRNVVYKLLIDWGTIGWFGIEVIRNMEGGVEEVYHVLAHTIRVHKSQEKFCQERGQNKVWFKKFGLEGKHFSAMDGKETSFNLKTNANELIFYKNFYPRSDYYGAPNVLAAIGDVVGLIGLRDYNLSFFENYGIPAGLIVLEGDWDEGIEKTIGDFIDKELKGSDNAHRTMVVTQPTGSKFTYKPLGTEVKEGSFRLYEQARRDNVLIAYSMPPERVGVRVTGSLGGNVAEEATQVYVQGVVEPLQTDIEEIINEKLLQSEIYDFKFENIDLRDYTAEVERMMKEVAHGIRTPNEARNELGLKPYPEGDKFFIASNLIEVGAPEEGMTKAEQDLLNDSTD